MNKLATVLLTAMATCAFAQPITRSQVLVTTSTGEIYVAPNGNTVSTKTYSPKNTQASTSRGTWDQPTEFWSSPQGLVLLMQLQRQASEIQSRQKSVEKRQDNSGKIVPATMGADPHFKYKIGENSIKTQFYGRVTC